MELNNVVSVCDNSGLVRTVLSQKTGSGSGGLVCSWVNDGDLAVGLTVNSEDEFVSVDRVCLLGVSGIMKLYVGYLVDGVLCFRSYVLGDVVGLVFG